MTAFMSLVESVTNDPQVRSWFPSQPVPLNLLAVRLPGGDGRFLINLVLAAREELGGNDAVLIPGAYFCWEWPSWKLVAMINLDVMPGLPTAKLHPGHGADAAFVEKVENALVSGEAPPTPGARTSGVYEAIAARLDPDGLRYGKPRSADGRVTLRQALEAAQRAISSRKVGPGSAGAPASSTAQRLSGRDGSDDTLDLTDFIRKMEDR